MRFTLLGLVAASMLACASVAGASLIVVENTDSSTQVNGTPHTISGFSLSGGTKLVVTTGTENGGGVGGSVDVVGITFDGQALASIVNVNDLPQRATIWYLDNPTASSGDIVVTYTGNASSGISALSISGAALGVLDSAGAQGTNSGTLAIDAGSLVVGSFVTNANTGSLINPDDPSTDIFSANIDGGAGLNAASAYFIEPNPAARTSFGFTGGSTSRPVAVAASFAMATAPEPSTFVLGLLGLVGLVGGRRRRRR